MVLDEQNIFLFSSLLTKPWLPGWTSHSPRAHHHSRNREVTFPELRKAKALSEGQPPKSCTWPAEISSICNGVRSSCESLGRQTVMARSERLPAASEYQRRYDPYLVKSSGAHENNPEDDQFHQVSVTQGLCPSFGSHSTFDLFVESYN